MSDLDKYKEKLKKFIKFITFVDLPINRKFFLFSIGVLFWFIILFLINLATNISINNHTNELVLRHIPHEKLSHAITRKLEKANDDVTVILASKNNEQVNQRLHILDLRLTDLQAFS